MSKQIKGGWEWPWSSNTSENVQKQNMEKPNVENTTAPSKSFMSYFTIPSFLKSKPVDNNKPKDNIKPDQTPTTALNMLGGKRKTKKAKKSKKSRTSKAKK